MTDGYPYHAQLPGSAFASFAHPVDKGLGRLPFSSYAMPRGQAISLHASSAAIVALAFANSTYYSSYSLFPRPSVAAEGGRATVEWFFFVGSGVFDVSTVYRHGRGNVA